MERRPLPQIGPKGRFRNWVWWKWFKCRRWWNHPMTPFEIGYSIAMLSRSHEHPYFTYLKLLSPIPWQSATKLPPEPREIMTDTNVILAAEAQTHELRLVNVWKWHDTAMSVLIFSCTNSASLMLGFGSNSIIGGLSSDYINSSVQVSVRRSNTSVSTSGTGLVPTSIRASWKIPANTGVKTQSNTQ